MILRLLLIAIALVVLLRLLGWKPPLGRRGEISSDPVVGNDSMGNATQAQESHKADADLVMCAQCGLSIPREAACRHGGRWACCIEHLDTRS